MSDTAVAAKPVRNAAKPAEPAAAVATPAPAQKVQTLREAQPKKFVPSSLWVLGQEYEILAVTVPADWTFKDVLSPLSWSAVARVVAKDANSTRRDKIGSLIYANGPHFCAMLRINAVKHDQFGSPNALDVMCIGPCVDLATGMAAPVDLKTGKAWSDPEPSKED